MYFSCFRVFVVAFFRELCELCVQTSHLFTGSNGRPSPRAYLDRLPTEKVRVVLQSLSRETPQSGKIGEFASMTRRRVLLVAGSILAICLNAPLIPAVRAAAEMLPSRLSDEDFWRIASDFSERSGSFQSDNLLSNERGLQYVIP